MSNKSILRKLPLRVKCQSVQNIQNDIANMLESERRCIIAYPLIDTMNDSNTRLENIFKN